MELEREGKLGFDCLSLMRSGRDVFMDKDAKHNSRKEREKMNKGKRCPK